MYFTQEDFKKIEEYFKQKAYKDTDFSVLPVRLIKDDDIVAIVHDGTNRKITFLSLSQKLAELVKSDAIRADDSKGNSAHGSTLNLASPMSVNQVGTGVIGVSIDTASTNKAGIVTVDNNINNNSVNPVQNKVISNALDAKVDDDAYLTYSEINKIIYDTFGF